MENVSLFLDRFYFPSPKNMGYLNVFGKALGSLWDRELPLHYLFVPENVKEHI